jgi:hypothetical protein
MVIWVDVPSVKLRHKIWHKHSLKGKLHRDFTNDCGDVPVARINEITGVCEPVVNPRGRAYAARNRLMYRS